MNETAGKWRDLAEKRRSHLLEMQQSGRWKYYFTEPVFVRRLRDAAELVQIWEPILPPVGPIKIPTAAAPAAGARLEQSRHSSATRKLPTA